MHPPQARAREEESLLQPAPNMHTLSHNSPLAQETPVGGLGKDMNIHNPDLLCDLILILISEVIVPSPDRREN